MLTAIFFCREGFKDLWTVVQEEQRKTSDEVGGSGVQGKKQKIQTIKLHTHARTDNRRSMESHMLFMGSENSVCVIA